MTQAAKVILLLGGVAPNGYDGWFTSSGMFLLRSRLLKIPGVSVSSYIWGSYGKAYNDLASIPSGVKRIVIGYSGGGSRATWVADMRPLQEIDLMVLYDPSPAWQMYPVTDNVRQVICYHNTKPNMPSPYGNLGGGQVKAVKFAHVNIQVRDIAEQHLLVQTDSTLHDMTVDAVKKLIS